MLVLDIPTQILLTILLSIDLTLQGVNWKFTYNLHQRGIIYDKFIFFTKLVRQWKLKQWAKKLG